MRAEEARELAMESLGEIHHIIEEIKDMAIHGERQVTFCNLTDNQIDKILKLGYETESCDNIHIIKW